MRQLNVYVNDRKAGVLLENLPGTGYSFKSVTLSKRKDRYESSTLFPFFANMLPEGANRKVICRTLKIDERDLFGLLAAMAGKDFIGGVHVKTASK